MMSEKAHCRIQRSADGVITNAADLTVSDVAMERVLCPACHQMVFEMWPLGWDRHAETPSSCTGLESTGVEDRKAEFKQQFRMLFR